MSTTIEILGGVGLFLLGMSTMTEGLKGFAGSSLPAVLGKAAATPLRGTFWGAVVTLIVQSSSATTMTTIGLVSAGLLTFPQGLGIVYGANVGTTGTSWLVALIGVRVSLTAWALPLIFVAALTKLLARGRVAQAGGAIAGFALLLYGLSILQAGMGGLAERLHPADLPAVVGEPGTGWWAGALGVLALVVIGIVMTTVMQSSTAAIAVTLSAQYAGVIDLAQGCALIIGQNIGTSTSSALAAIGASITAKRLALSYILFKLIAALIALVLFPITTPFLIRAATTIEGVTLLAAYHTAYNVVGVAVLLPLTARFTRFVERMLPDRGTPITRSLDPLALANPIIAVEAVRRTIAGALKETCARVSALIVPKLGARPVTLGEDSAPTLEAERALSQAQVFTAEINGPPESQHEQQRLISTLHALDHAWRLVATVRDGAWVRIPSGGPDVMRAIQLCSDAMHNAAMVAGELATTSTEDARVHPSASQPGTTKRNQTLAQLERSARALKELQDNHRKTTLKAVATGELSVDEALARVDAVRRLDVMTHHAWRSLAHLLDPDLSGESEPAVGDQSEHPRLVLASDVAPSPARDWV